jgi:hypothetical protein
VFPVRHELSFYIPEDGILHSHRRETFTSYIITKMSRAHITNGSNANSSSIPSGVKVKTVSNTILIGQQLSRYTDGLPVVQPTNWRCQGEAQPFCSAQRPDRLSSILLIE